MINVCSCSTPNRQTTAEGIEICAACGERIANTHDRLLLLIARQQSAILSRLESLETGSAVSHSNGNAASPLIGARELATRLGRPLSWVYAHSAELGAIPVGDGAKPRLFFDLATVKERLAARSRGEDSQTAPDPQTPARRRPHRSNREGVELLPIRGAKAR